MPEDKEAVIAHYRRMREGLLAAIDGLSDEQMAERTLDGWSVKDHIAHLAFWDDIRAADVTRASAGHESVWRMTPEQEAALGVIAHDLRRDISLAQARWELAVSHQRLLEALAAAEARALDPSL
ncbi:MAG TPA: maleylpyruvate isomerase N-terminal domain-containing protein, partial [Dehalococcoidia bacterium]|nr:maleylpyruvate isomerase N-terminal domain-containing protein [Dehalococcoidia bacterium]